MLNQSEKRILTAALEISEKKAGDLMKPLDKVFMLDIDTCLTRDTLNQIYQKGYSRIPIYEKERNNIVGILMSRELILVNPEKMLISIRQLFKVLIKNVIEIPVDTKLEPVLNCFKKGHSHMGIVTELVPKAGEDEGDIKIVGILTLEDIIEVLIHSEELIDQDFI